MRDQIWGYEDWHSVEPNTWAPAIRGERPDDQMDFHVDLGCGTVKKGRIGIDRFPAPGVNIVMDLDTLEGYGLPGAPGADAEGQPFHGLPFGDNQVESMISHHVLEHIGDGFVPLMDECWRVLKPDAPFRIIVPLFPSRTAVEDPDHRRYFMEDSFASFLGTRSGECWLESFSVPYTKGRFLAHNRECTPLYPPEQRWTEIDRREMRLTLRAIK